MQCQSSPNGDILRVIDQMSDALHLPAASASEDMQDNIQRPIRSHSNPQMTPRLFIYPYKDQDPDSGGDPVLASPPFSILGRVWFETERHAVLYL